MNKLDEFLTRNVEGYLLGDIATLKTAKVAAGKAAGAAGYPLVSTVLAGVELLGGLLQLSTWSDAPGMGSRYFQSYWKSYLYPNDQARATAGPTLYKLVRHGLAHAFVMKADISVSKERAQYHLTKDVNGTVLLDAVQFADDFTTSYRAVKHRASLPASAPGPNSRTMLDRLEDMEREYAKKAAPLLAALNLPAAQAWLPDDVPVSAAVMFNLAVGVSGSAFPGPGPVVVTSTKP